MKKLSTFILMSVILVLAWSCQSESELVEYFDKPTDVVNPNPPLPPVDFEKASLGELAAKQGIKLGTAFTYNEYFQNDQIAQILKREFKSVTFGNEMKHESIVQANGKLKFDTADKMVEWAEEAGTELFGHVLGWHSQQQIAYLNGLIDKAAADNSASLLQDNWNFEQGNMDGFQTGGFEITANYTDVFAGEYAALSGEEGATIDFTVALEAGKPYILSFWAKADGGDATVSAESGDGQKAQTAVSEEWAKYSATFNTKSVGEFSYKLSATPGVAIDNIRVIETEPEPEDDTKADSYINPYAIEGGLDFEKYVAGPSSQLTESGDIVQVNGSDYVTVTDEFANSGSLSLKMDNGDGHAANAWDIQIVTKAFPVEVGKTYRIAWYARASAEADIQMDIRGDGSTQYKNSAWGQYPKMTTDWTYQYLDYTVAEGSELSFGFYGATEAVTYYIDDIQVFEASKEGDYTNYIDPTNLLPGGDIEAADNWGIWNGGTYVELLSRNDPEIGSNADFVHSALQAYKVDNTETGWTGGSSWHIQLANNAHMEVTGGESYRIAMWVKSPDGAQTIQVHLTYQDGGPSTNYLQISGIGEDWTYIYTDFVLPAEAEEVQLVIDAAYDTATYYIDDVQFFPTPVESCIDPGSVVDDGELEAYSSVDDLKNAGWQVNGADHVSITDDAHHGSKAVRMDNSAGTATNAWDIQLVTKAYPIEPGKVYRIAWQAKADAADVDMQIDIRLPGGTQYKNSAWGQYDKMGSDWTYQFIDVETADGDDTIQVGFYGGGSTNVITIDCIQIFSVESTPSASRARIGFGKYDSWDRPAPAKARRLSKAPEFESGNKYDGELAADAIGAAYKTFVYSMVEHFNPYAWDVVNETFTEEGNFRTLENSGADNHFIWGTYYASTKDWVDKAFAYATDAAKIYGKKPVLYINDYNLETSEAKRKAFCEYAKGNDQVTGVGTQMHLDMATSDLESKITASLKDLVATGKMVRISELDIKCTDEEAQAALYKYIFEKYIELVPSAQRGGITIWGINDKDSWVGESNAPLLWKGSKYEKKAAYEALYVYLCELAGINPYQEEE